jgi:pimeloyl-ACP methyl ester carboxylesterase
VGFGLDTALAQLDPLLRGRSAMPRREAVQAALNGVLGDYLVASSNSLAIPMQLRQHGRPLELKEQTGGKLLVLVHGLCMNDLQWQREGHDHGAALAEALGYTPIYLHYNTGLPIAANGQAFAGALEALLAQWPVPVKELAIVGHSMGGLVARSACHAAQMAGHAWLRRLKKLVCLGTPHHGAPLERAGNWVDILLGVSPYTAPLARLGMVRSAGIKDLRHGRFLPPGDPDAAMQLPRGVKVFVAAATKQQAPDAARKRLPGDGLVPVDSALGVHKSAALTLPIPKTRQQVFYGLNHFDLLSSAEVASQLVRWLR